MRSLLNLTEAFVGLAAAAVITLAGPAAFEWSLRQVQEPPAGEVTVTQLPTDVDSALYAQARNGALL
jgi:hypothetical protein